MCPYIYVCEGLKMGVLAKLFFKWLIGDGLHLKILATFFVAESV